MKHSRELYSRSSMIPGIFMISMVCNEIALPGINHILHKSYHTSIKHFNSMSILGTVKDSVTMMTSR